MCGGREGGGREKQRDRDGDRDGGRRRERGRVPLPPLTRTPVSGIQPQTPPQRAHLQIQPRRGLELRHVNLNSGDRGTRMFRAQSRGTVAESPFRPQSVTPKPVLDAGMRVHPSSLEQAWVGKGDPAGPVASALHGPWLFSPERSRTNHPCVPGHATRTHVCTCARGHLLTTARRAEPRKGLQTPEPQLRLCP